MNCNEEDILNIDIDPDFLISLVGKLSLNNIPDITESLQFIENSTETALFETDLTNNTCSSQLECDISAINQAKDSSCSNSLNDESKDRFISSISPLSAPYTTENPLPQDNFLDDSSSLWNTLASDSKKNNESCRAKEKLVKSKDASSKRNTNRKKASDAHIQENITCDNAESHWQHLPFLSGASFPHKSVNSLQDVFSQRGMVYDVQLSDIGGSLNLPLNTDEETNFLTLDERVEKSVCSPDSEISTSPCPSAASPTSPTTDHEYTDDSEDYEDSFYEDDLERLLAELIEIEHSLRYEEIPQSTVNVPVLKDAINAEDHIEKILNFLKEPISNDPSSQLSLLEEEDEKPIFPELLVENTSQSVFKLSSKNIKKPSPRSKKHKFGFDFKYPGKYELRHSSIFSKGKHFLSRNKILKQIQRDERIQKQVKVIEGLIVSRKLKRTDTDDRESKKRRILPTDSCHKSQ